MISVGKWRPEKLSGIGEVSITHDKPVPQFATEPQ